MAQVLVTLGLSTKAMKEWRISQSIHAQCFLFIDCSSEKFAKRLRGRTDVDEAFKRIDSLTKDETILAVAKRLEVSFAIDGSIEGLKKLAGNANIWLPAMDENSVAINGGM